MMRLVVELTNRCNLECRHCFSGRHGGSDELPMPLLRRILADARAAGFDDVSFTGGEPAVYPGFIEALQLCAHLGYRFGWVTNGWSFPALYPRLAHLSRQITMITLSLDGASQAVHDQVRGEGSFRRAMKTASLCMINQLPFTVNSVITAKNRHEAAAMVTLATRLGASGIRFGHLLPSPIAAEMGLDLAPDDRKAVDSEIRRLGHESAIPVALAPGYHTADPAPCGPLRANEANVDCRGNLTLCCHLSGNGDGSGDVAANLNATSFAEAWERLGAIRRALAAHKQRRLDAGALADTDAFPCWYCSLYFGKLGWMEQYPQHSWSAARQAWPVRAAALVQLERGEPR